MLNREPGARSFSDVQEAAQFLAGEDMPQSLLSSSLGKTKIPTSEPFCLLINLTTYDGWIEKTCKKWADNGNSKMKFKTLSLTKTLTTAQYVEKVLAMKLMEDCCESLVKVCGSNLIPKLSWGGISNLLPIT